MAAMQFEASLKKELAAAEAGRARFVAEFSDADFEGVVGGWRAKLARVAQVLLLVLLVYCDLHDGKRCQLAALCACAVGCAPNASALMGTQGQLRSPDTTGYCLLAWLCMPVS